MMSTRIAEQRRTVRAVFMLLGAVTILTYVCQWFIFKPNWNELALSVLLGTCMTLVGAFAALLASPYGAEDEKRLSKVSATIVTLLTGYVLAKIIDPVVGQLTNNTSVLHNVKNGANSLIGLIGFLGGFLGTYAFRAYVTIEPGDVKKDVQADAKPAEGGQAAKG